MGINEIDAADVQTKIENGTTFIDVREAYEIAEIAYDIADAKHIPLGEIPSQASELLKEAPYIIGCRSGARSMNACQYLASQGFTDVQNLKGGIIQWSTNGFPTK